ncbi:acetoacetate--CoA ligase [Desulfopila sp. IMCC35006]|uniref:acetoacetate--CoA ligase n=1 Tax=Desulfopila sp. IMCC35006 TaxID=2569542 RepID=UPI0010ABBC6F|nr:acetoacetate--CoA ligase [Desulfopila sp. IMCC35006]TKB26566.1 acetoacetate--CoA ligase [Desulfopila sp. IMCC35006]
MPKPLWVPSEQRIKASNMYRFMREVNRRCGTDFADYEELYQWSVDNIADFWAEMYRFADIKATKPYEQVIDDPHKMPGAHWFAGSRLNFAENLLRYRDEKTALIFRGEDAVRRSLSYKDLFAATAKVAAALRHAGVVAGDRVVGFMPNMPESIIAMLAATSIGAAWSSCSPDFGSKGVLDRFGQTRPKILFTAEGYFFKGKPLDSLAKIAAIIEQIPSIERIIVVPYTRERPDLTNLPGAVHYADFCRNDADAIDFAQLPFEHPLYIMYSSGTTGLPKCMVQSAGGVLLHQLKELLLHTDLHREDTIFYFTTCGWMMWNWLTTSLAVGATLVLYDGNPFYPGPDALWRMAQEERISVFGTSAGYIAALKNAGVKPGKQFDLSPLKAVLSTGSPLSKEDFHFIYKDIKADLQLASISGGSDLNGCFALGNPMGPVYEGELQCRGLGMKVFAYDENGSPVIGQQGELVCTAPFPSMPIYFWDDPDGKKYQAAYFDRYPGVWTHGDFIEVTERGGLIFYGRSDATLNPGGVRIGTAEIYRIIEQMAEIEDSVVVAQRWQNDSRVILFVKMQAGYELTDALRQKISSTIRQQASPRHVPAKIIATPDIPYTLNMKKVELAVQKMIHGQEVKNKDALKNPQALDFFADIKELNFS